MSKKNIVRSPFFYVGDKYKLMTQIRKLVPENIEKYVEPFVGGGSSFLNSEGSKYFLNDIDEYVVQLHEFLVSWANEPEVLLDKIFGIIEQYGLSCSYKGHTAPDGLKIQYKKTYYAKYNKEAYISLRNDFNKDQSDMLRLYVLLIYGFNRMIRFNLSGNFNVPVGNVDFNKNVYDALINYLEFAKNNDLIFKNMDYKEFLNTIDICENSYVFLDPPYLISMSEYNKLWNEDKEKELCDFLDELHKSGIRFGITNLINHKGKINYMFLEWSKKYKVYNITSNYISFNDNTIKDDSKEVFVTNYGAI